MCVHHLQRQGHCKDMRTTSPILSTEGEHIQPRKGREKTPERRGRVSKEGGTQAGSDGRGHWGGVCFLPSFLFMMQT